MDLPAPLELFSRTVENRFVLSLFHLLLCGVILFVILRGWRGRARPLSDGKHVLLFLAFGSLGASFALGAAHAGTFLFLQTRHPERPFDLLSHGLQAGAWLLLAASARVPPSRQAGAPRAADRELLPLFGGLVLIGAVFVLAEVLSSGLSGALDLANPFLLCVVLALFHRRPLGRRALATRALAFLLAASLLHLASSRPAPQAGSVLAWNLEQLAWSLALLSFALAIGEASQDLFDRVFVRLHIAFIVLAGLMTLVIIQTETAEYLGGLRSRSDELAQFVRGHVDYFRRRGESLADAVRRTEFLERLTLGFASLPELKIVRVSAGGGAASFEIDANGLIRRQDDSGAPPLRSSLDPEEYFPIEALPLATRGEVEFYGTREFLNRHSRTRIVLIFSLFTGIVVLSTLMIGLVVRSASQTIVRQAGEIEGAQRRLLQASKLAAIGELAAGVAHEINNPATTILSRASFLLSQDGVERSPSDQEDLEAIVAQAQRIALITRSLLTFSRPQAASFEPVPVARVVELGLQPVADALDAQRIELELELPPALPPVPADEGSLARALENVFRNAVDAMPTGGTLRVRASSENGSGRRVRLEISDTGVGIPAAARTRIFDPFFTTKEVGKGTGLGLAIVHGVVQEHRGTIAVESEPGAGTTFTIVLPAEA